MEKNILITGGTKGIGFAVAKSLVTAGYNVILTYGSDFHQAEKARMELHQAGKKSVMVVKADITEKKSIDILDDFLAEHNIRLFSVVFNIFPYFGGFVFLPVSIHEAWCYSVDPDAEWLHKLHQIFHQCMYCRFGYSVGK